MLLILQDTEKLSSLLLPHMKNLVSLLESPLSGAIIWQSVWKKTQTNHGKQAHKKIVQVFILINARLL